jgi:hypothetical protein
MVAARGVVLVRHGSGSLSVICPSLADFTPIRATTPYTGNLFVIALRQQFNAHAKIVADCPVWFRPRRVRDSILLLFGENRAVPEKNC